jgi:hypothetical protein
MTSGAAYRDMDDDLLVFCPECPKAHCGATYLKLIHLSLLNPGCPRPRIRQQDVAGRGRIVGRF